VWGKRARGLAEWNKAKPPMPAVEKKSKKKEHQETPEWVFKRIEEAKILARAWKLQIGKDEWNDIAARQVPDEQYGDVIVTSDPAYILGASTLTTGWGSCLRHPEGKKRTSTKIWARISGVRIAYVPSSKDISIGDVTRKAMAARCWIWTYHEMGTKVRRSSQKYGDETAREQLAHELTKAKIYSEGDGPVLGEARVRKSVSVWTEGGIKIKSHRIYDPVTHRQKAIVLRFHVGGASL
jgi:hypothetical protein